MIWWDWHVKRCFPAPAGTFCFEGRNIPNSEKVNPRSEFPKRTFKGERSKLRHYKDLPRRISSTKTKSRFLAPLGMTGGEVSLRSEWHVGDFFRNKALMARLKSCPDETLP